MGNKTSKIVTRIRMRVILIIVCSIVFLFSSIQLTIRLVAYSKDNSQYEKIRTISGKKDQITTTVSTEADAKVDVAESKRNPYTEYNGDKSELNSEGILKYYETLKKLNKDMVGWIYMPGYKKEIDYPVMQAKDNQFYLYRDFYKNSSHAGSIYIDTGNQAKNVDRHIIIYGHSMFDMSMFGNLRDYPGKKAEYTKNTKIYLDFMNTRLEYEVFSTYYIEGSYNYRQINFSNDEKYMTFLNRILRKSVYDFGVTLSPMDKIITLSTCNGDIMLNGRSVIHARLISQIRYDGFGEKELTQSDKSGTKKVISANVYLKKLSMQYNNAKIKVNSLNTGITGSSKDVEISKNGESTLSTDTNTEKSTDNENTNINKNIAKENNIISETDSKKNVDSKSTINTDTSKSEIKELKPIPNIMVDVIFDPPFNTIKSKFTATIPTGVEEIIINIQLEDPEAKVSMLLNNAMITLPALKLKKSSTTITLPALKILEGNNTVKIKISSRDGQFEKVYTINITRGHD